MLSFCSGSLFWFQCCTNTFSASKHHSATTNHLLSINIVHEPQTVVDHAIMCQFTESATGTVSQSRLRSLVMHVALYTLWPSAARRTIYTLWYMRVSLRSISHLLQLDDPIDVSNSQYLYSDVISCQSHQQPPLSVLIVSARNNNRTPVS